MTWQILPNARPRTLLGALGLGAAMLGARADVITDWSLKADALIAESRLGTPPAIRVMAIVQTDAARFWEYSLPAIRHGVLRSAAAAPGRDVSAHARLFAAAAQAMDDAMIAVFDAKYHYNFWRPSTAICNGDDQPERQGCDASLGRRR